MGSLVGSSANPSAPTAGVDTPVGGGGGGGGGVTSFNGLTGAVLGVSSFNGATGALNYFPTLNVANYAALAAAPAGTYTAGQVAFVTSGQALFLLMTSAAAARANVRIAASGLAGSQWVRVPMRNPYWEVQTTWAVDPTNTSGVASDDNTGLSIAAPLLTYNELSLRLAAAEIAQATAVACGPGDQQAGDNPTFSYVCRGQSLMVFNGTPTVVFSSTVTGYVAAAFGSSAADDCEFSDTAVPGGSFTTAGALAQGVFIKRTNGTVIYAAVLKDLGGTTCRVAQPYNPASGTANVAFANGDAYQLVKLPAFTAWVLPPGGNLTTKFSFVTWNVPPNNTDGIKSAQFIVSYIEKTPRFSGMNTFFGGCCIDSGGGSWETGASVSNPFQMCSFKGTGATRYSFSGAFNSEASITSWQGCNMLIENGIWNSGQMAFYDSATAQCGAATGTGGRMHFLGPISGKGNTGKLAVAQNASQIVVQGLSVATGSFFTAASTTDALPIESGVTASAVAIPLDVNMNGVFATT